MEQKEFDERKAKLFEYLEKVGIDKAEAELYISKEIVISKDLGMSEGDSLGRGLISTVNYYRKYLDKMGNRVKFLCLGVSSPTDYGLKHYVKGIKEKWNSMELSQADREKMLNDRVISDLGIPLHNKETTLFEDKHGTPINIDDEITQTLFGVVDNNGKMFPSVVRAIGKRACNEDKLMYQWSLISGEQGTGKFPGYIVLNSRELMMKPLKGTSRIKLDEYETYVKTLFTSDVIDLDDDVQVKRLEEGGERLFLENARIQGYGSSTYGISIPISNTKSKYDVTIPILAEGTLPNVIKADVDPASESKLWIYVNIRKRKPTDLKLKLDILGMYTENPVDKDWARADASTLLGEDEQKAIITNQPVGQNVESRENEAFFQAMERANGQNHGRSQQ